MDWQTLSEDRIREIVAESNSFAAQHPGVSGESTAWIGNRDEEQKALLGAVRGMQKNGPGIVTTAKAALMAADPSQGLFELLNIYGKEVDAW